jgi:hypothetical protein
VSCTAFAGSRRIAAGTLAEVAVRVKQVLDRRENGPVLIFDDMSGEQIEVDLRGTADDIRARLSEASDQRKIAQASPETPRGPGRPRLGVIAREVTLLPRHWEWLGLQPGGASVALRKLVEDARRANGGRDRVRRSQESAYRFMSAVAGNLPGFEEATRALFASKRKSFEEQSAAWPKDVREHAGKLAAEAFEGVDS